MCFPPLCLPVDEFLDHWITSNLQKGGGVMIVTLRLQIGPLKRAQRLRASKLFYRIRVTTNIIYWKVGRFSMACGTIPTRATYSRHYTSQSTGSNTHYLQITSNDFSWGNLLAPGPWMRNELHEFSWDREPEAQVARRWLDVREALGSNSTSIH